MNCYFCASIPEPPGVATLDDFESRHAAAARRQRAGDRVLLIDGRGVRAVGTIESIDRSATEVAVHTREEAASEEPVITLASAIPKGDRFKVLLDMMTQLGVRNFVPLNCERSVVRPDPSSLDRWQRICMQACKQSNNPFLPVLDPPRDPAAFAQRMRREGVAVWAADPVGETMAPQRAHAAAALCIGPEGGFSDGERQGLRGAGVRFVNLGPNILRIETAAVAAVCAVRDHRRVEPPPGEA